ncbi:hypothetical protein DFH29DRAFT_653357 [Suillus ampliporus]|nr:hypothetical protein DFH29DRAFT_653357 [Suillus ampliporus]
MRVSYGRSVQLARFVCALACICMAFASQLLISPHWIVWETSQSGLYSGLFILSWISKKVGQVFGYWEPLDRCRLPSTPAQMLAPFHQIFLTYFRIPTRLPIMINHHRVHQGIQTD